MDNNKVASSLVKVAEELIKEAAGKKRRKNLGKLKTIAEVKSAIKSVKKNFLTALDSFIKMKDDLEDVGDSLQNMYSNVPGKNPEKKQKEIKQLLDKIDDVVGHIDVDMDEEDSFISQLEELFSKL